MDELRAMDQIQEDIEIEEVEDEIISKQNSDLSDDVIPDTFDFSNFEQSLLLVASSYFGSMNISMDMSEKILADMEKVIKLTCTMLKSKLEHIPSATDHKVKHEIVNSINFTRDFMISTHNKMNTEQKLKTTLIRKKLLAPPVTKIYNEVEEQVGNDLVTIKSEVTILPIKFQIEQFLSKAGILNAILDNHMNIERTNGNIISNFLSGSYWNHLKGTFGNKIVIPIFIYNDDFGPDDGLSPHASPNKISAYYYGFPTLPPQISSRIDSIFVAMLAKSQDIKIEGANTLLKILANQLKPLEDDGILIGDKRIYFAPTLILGDNLGINLNLGLPTGFRANYHCKTCYMPKALMEVTCSEDENLIRTADHYDSCIKAIARGGETYGLSFHTNLNILSSFNFSRNLIADIMHDLMSGVFIYGVVQILKKSTDQKKFSLRDFNEIKNNFDYGAKDKSYIVEDILNTHLANGTIRCHARESWNLIKYLPAILSKLLPLNCPIRKYGSILCELLEYCLKNSYTEDDLNYLDSIVRKHNQEFLRLFNVDGRRPLPPKAHYLLHYSRIIRNSGPLKFLSSMRYEAKHQQLKAYANVCSSRRNFCFSLSKKICFQFSYNLLKNENYLKKVTDMRVKRPSHTNSSAIKDRTNCSKVKYKGTMYETGDFIFSNCLESAYKLFEIGVDSSKDDVIFMTRKYKITKNHNISLYKLNLNETDNTTEIKHVDEFIFPPVNLHSFEGHYYLHFEEF